jgi:hypothetical protein
MHGWARSRTLGWTLLGVAVVACGSAWYVRPRGAARRVGIDWRATVRDATCTTNRHETMCTTVPPWAPAPATHATLQFNPWTRRLTRASRTWTISDSTHWSVMLDSIRRAMEGAHGERAVCDRAETGFPIAEAWRFGEYETRLYAGKLPSTRRRQPTLPLHIKGKARSDRSAPSESPRTWYLVPGSWYASVQAVPWGSVGCGRAFRYVLLTPAQIAQQMREWAADHLGFW